MYVHIYIYILAIFNVWSVYIYVNDFIYIYIDVNVLNIKV